MPTSQPENHLDNDKEELRNKLFEGKTLLQNTQDIVARNNTGYTYAELKSEDCAEVGELDYKDELQEIDKTVNLLLHLYSHHTQSKLKAFAEEVEKAIGEDLPLDDKTKATDNTSGRTGRRARNQLRKQLREALKAIKEKYEL